MPGHGSRVLDGVPEIGVLEVLLALEIASVHLLSQHCDVVDVLFEEEGVLLVELLRYLPEIFPDLSKSLAQTLQLLLVEGVVLQLHPRVLFGEDLGVEVRFPGHIRAWLLLVDGGGG